MRNKLFIFLYAGALLLCAGGFAMAKEDIAQSEDMKSVMEELQAIKAAAQTGETVEKSEIKETQTQPIDKTENKKMSASQNKEHLFVTGRYAMDVEIIEMDGIKKVSGQVMERALAHYIVRNNERLYFINPLFVDVYDRRSLKRINDVDYGGAFVPGKSKAVVTPDGKKLYIGVVSWDKVNPTGVFVIDLVKNKQVGLLMEDSLETGFIAGTKDGKYIFAADYGCLKKISTENEQVEEVVRLDAHEQIRDIAVVSEEEIYLAVYTYDPLDDLNTKPQDRMVLVNSKKRTKHMLNITIPKIRRMDILKDGNIYVMGGNQLMKLRKKDQKVLGDFKLEFEGMVAELSDDEKRLYISSVTKNEVYVLDSKTAKILNKINMSGEPYGVYVAK